MAGLTIDAIAIHDQDKWSITSAIGMMGLSVPDGEYFPNYVHMAIGGDGGHKSSTLSICEGCKSEVVNLGYGIHLRAENDDPAITFIFRDGREEECHAPATDSDFNAFIGIVG